MCLTVACSYALGARTGGVDAGTSGGDEGNGGSSVFDLIDDPDAFFAVMEDDDDADGVS
jgi:hypothetical protein